MSTLYGTDIGTELSTGTRFAIPKPAYSDEAIQAHEEAEEERKEMAKLLWDAYAEEIDRINLRIQNNLSLKVDVGSDPVLLVEKQSEMKKAEREMRRNVELTLKGTAKC